VENRSIYLAPLAVAAVVLIGFAVNVIHSANQTGTPLALHLPNDPTPIQQPYAIAAVLLASRGCLQARSTVSTLCTVSAATEHPVLEIAASLRPHHRTFEGSIALIVLPLVTFAIIVATHIAMLALHTAVLLASGAGLATLRNRTH